MTCIFCDIAVQKAPAAMVAETSGSMAFLDLFPVNKGHLLVVPREHAETILDVSEAGLTDTILLLQKVTHAVKKAFDARGITIIQANGEAAGQVVKHLHFHVIPRYGESHGHLTSWDANKAEPGTLEMQAKEIKSFLE